MGKRDIRGNTAVITGAASGIGRGIVRALAREHCTILLADINEAGLDQTCEMVRQSGGRGEVFLCDVSRLDDVMRMADHCFAAWGKVDILVNNAGVASAGFMGDIPIEDWEWIVSTNFWGVVYGCHAFVPRMKQHGGGYIVNVASAAGILSSAEMAPYNATKAAVISISETLKSELAPYNIGVTVLCPTYVKTSLLEKMRVTDDFQRHCATTGMVNARWSTEKFAGLVIDAIKREKMYVVPQAAAKIFWISKRLSPPAFFGFLAFLMRMGWGRKLMFQLARRGF
ncbi:MAG TPA: SDR family NAD(P)-dependent oxidoreductase [Deltaproteobacteria bacterium]|nr:SDR family NAD(P)-dependent oxidoreductase [Deltaproteobacteria bacterium]